MWLLLSVRVYEVIHIRHFVILPITLATWCTCKAQALQMNRLSCQCIGLRLLSRGSCSQAQTCWAQWEERHLLSCLNLQGTS